MTDTQKNRIVKVVLFCGGHGIRMRDYSEKIPKPMVPIGPRPIIWHVMKYYSHFGYHDFILCLGYKADYIKNYFLNYNEASSNNFILSDSGKSVNLLNTDIDNWKITFVDTGYSSNIGERLTAVKSYLKDEDIFMANYSDTLTDCHLPDHIDDFSRSNNCVGSFLTVKPNFTHHVINDNNRGFVTEIYDSQKSGILINGGYFIFKKEIFNYINPGDDLIIEPFNRLIKFGGLRTYRHEGFWASMETFKDRMILNDLQVQSQAPWELWKNK